MPPPPGAASALADWFISAGGTYVPSAIAVEENHYSDGSHCLRAKTFIPADTVIMTIPATSYVQNDAITVDSPMPPAYKGDEETYEWHITALTLLMERRKQQQVGGEGSRFATYLDTLPSSLEDCGVGNLNLWSEEQIAQLQVYEVRQDALQGLHAARVLYDACFVPLMATHDVDPAFRCVGSHLAAVFAPPLLLSLYHLCSVHSQT